MVVWQLPFVADFRIAVNCSIFCEDAVLKFANKSCPHSYQLSGLSSDYVEVGAYTFPFKPCLIFINWYPSQY